MYLSCSFPGPLLVVAAQDHHAEPFEEPQASREGKIVQFKAIRFPWYIVCKEYNATVLPYFWSLCADAFYLFSFYQPANAHLRLFAPEDVPAVHKLLNDHLDATLVISIVLLSVLFCFLNYDVRSTVLVLV